MNKKINELKHTNTKTVDEKIASLERMQQALDRLSAINQKKNNENQRNSNRQ